MAAAIKHVRTSVLDIAYEESGPADGTPVLLMHGFPYDPRALTASCRCFPRLPRDRAVPARLRADALSLRRDTMRSGEQAALGNDLQGTDGRAQDRARGARRLRLGRARGVHRRGAVAGARDRARYRRRLQHARRQSLGEARERRAGVSLLVSVLLLYRARPRRADARTAATSRGCCGSCGRRTGASTTRRSRRPRSRSTIRISSTW